jgi:ComF family protein
MEDCRFVYPPICAGCGMDGYRFCPQCLSEVKIFTGNHCISCGKPILLKQSICSDCQGMTSIITDLCSWAEFEGPLREAIHHLKYQQDIGLGDYFSPFLIEQIEKRNWQFDLVVPVPISKSRLKSRGYNQSELLTRPIARFFHVAHSTKALIRIKETESQFSLSAIERNQNMEDAFFGFPAKLIGRSVLVVDDIITTGATMNHCAKALYQAGAKEVYGISIAKTVRHRK